MLTSLVSMVPLKIWCCWGDVQVPWRVFRNVFSCLLVLLYDVLLGSDMSSHLSTVCWLYHLTIKYTHVMVRYYRSTLTNFLHFGFWCHDFFFSAIQTTYRSGFKYKVPQWFQFFCFVLFFFPLCICKDKILIVMWVSLFTDRFANYRGKNSHIRHYALPYL